MGSRPTYIHATLHKLAEKWGPIYRLLLPLIPSSPSSPLPFHVPPSPLLSPFFFWLHNRLQVGPTPVVVITDPTIIREAFHGLESPVQPHFISETFRQVCVVERERRARKEGREKEDEGRWKEQVVASGERILKWLTDKHRRWMVRYRWCSPKRDHSGLCWEDWIIPSLVTCQMVLLYKRYGREGRTSKEERIFLYILINHLDFWYFF